MRNPICLLVLCVAVSGSALGGCGSSDSIASNPNAKTNPNPFADPSGEPTNPGEDPNGKPVDPTDPNAPPASRGALATGLTISEVAMFQAAKVSLAKGGKAVSALNAPIVAGRAGILRVYVTPDASWTAHEVTAELRLESGETKEPLLLDTKSITRASADDNLATTFNFEIPGDKLAAGTSYAVAIREKTPATAGGTEEGGAQYPAGGALESLKAEAGGQVVKIKIVPVQYNADGTGRLPDTSAAQLERYRQAAYAVYPAAKVEITVREPYAWPTAISATSGQGFSSILQAIVNLRLRDGAPKDVYYYGTFLPKASFQEFCGRGCILGLSGLVQSERDTSQRASVGVGYRGQEDTMVHEVGHAQGREHAPSGGAQGTDPDFPYSNGGIGVWGYNLNTKALVSPTRTLDYMGYGSPTFTSDYTFKELFKRVKAVNAAAKVVSFAEPQRFRFLTVGEAGELSWGESVTLENELFSEPHTMTYVDDRGNTLATVTGHYYPYSDIAGGYWLVPEGPIDFRKLTIKTKPSNVTMANEILRRF